MNNRAPSCSSPANVEEWFRSFPLRNLVTLRLGLVLILLFAVFTRFFALAAKPLHHDESLFAYYSYYLYKGWGYEYQPILHGPVLENVTALIFFLFGDSKFTMRLPAVIGGLALFPIAWFWRRYLGRAGTVTAFLLLALSPSLTYYSRFLRNDVPLVAVTFWCALATLRAFETGSARYVLGATLAAAMMFCMMESSIFFFAACIGFLGVIVLTDWIQGVRLGPGTHMRWDDRVSPARPSYRVGPPSALTPRIGCLVAALALELLAAWLYWRIFSFTLPLDKPIRRLGALAGLELQAAGAYELAAALAFPFFYALCAIAYANWLQPRGRRGVLHHFLRVCWNNRLVIVAGLAIAVGVFATLFTTWFTHVRGKDFTGRDVLLTPVQIYRNTWDYWWDQHSLHRIKGPFHYYLPILFLYELPVVLIVLTGWWRSLVRGRPGQDVADAAETRGGGWAAWAGRWKHVALIVLVQTTCLVLYTTGTTVAREVFHCRLDWGWIDKRLHLTGPAHFFLILFYVQLLVHVTAVLFVRGRIVEAFLTFWAVASLFAYSYAGEKVPWLTVHTIGPLCLLAGLHVQRWLGEVRLARWQRWCVLTLACVAVLWQLRNLTFANFVHPHSPAERLVYNHTSPDIEYAMSTIERLGRETNYGKALPLLVRGEMEWPLYWYLRDWSNASAPTDETAETTSRPVVLVNWEASDTPNLVDNYRILRLKVREWWEPPMLSMSAMADAWRVFTPRESRRNSDNGMKCDYALLEWRKLWHYLAYREIWLDPQNLAFSNNANEFAFCVRKDVEESYLSRLMLGAMPPRGDVPVYPRRTYP